MKRRNISVIWDNSDWMWTKGLCALIKYMFKQQQEQKGSSTGFRRWYTGSICFSFMCQINSTWGTLPIIPLAWWCFVIQSFSIMIFWFHSDYIELSNFAILALVFGLGVLVAGDSLQNLCFQKPPLEGIVLKCWANMAHRAATGATSERRMDKRQFGCCWSVWFRPEH